ncbi:hypothetical protein DIPPA_32772 [Diplonema papillatum]|nr:hypothetical protein DIPPA_32772 [Diplonema papillatum]
MRKWVVPASTAFVICSIVASGSIYDEAVQQTREPEAAQADWKCANCTGVRAADAVKTRTGKVPATEAPQAGGEALEEADARDWSPPALPARVANCPRRYLTVNPHTWGRHHNQLQTTVQGIVAAHLLNRTFVIGHFRHAKRWFDARDFYSFSELARYFCIVDIETAKKDLAGDRSVACFGQTVDEMPIGKQLHLKCRNLGPVAKSFPIQTFKQVVREAWPKLRRAAATVINVSGQLAFYLRPGLPLLAQAFGLLRPAKDVGDEVASFLSKTYGPNPRYLSVHLRYREGTCNAEIDTEFAHTFAIDAPLLDELREQCKVNSAYISKTLRASLGSSVESAGSNPDKFPLPTFLASDHQNKTAEQELVVRGAIMYDGLYGTQEVGGLKGLATDYFLMRSGYIFIGNSASSVSQNTCFGRLLYMPWRRACAGWKTALFREMMTTDIAPA